MLHPVLGSYLTQIAGSAPALREGLRTKPAKDNSGDALEALSKAYEQRHKDLGLEMAPVQFKAGNPLPGGFEQSIKDGTVDKLKLGAHQMVKLQDGTIGDRIHYNPNAARDIVAHEMGHAVSRKTKVGEAVRNLRGNPKLALALAAASGVLPVANAVLTPGDDDYDEAIMGTMALAAPTLIDEGLATKNALAMLDAADMRATLGQRGRLAGALLSYAAAPMIAGSLGTAIGNQFDEDV